MANSYKLSVKSCSQPKTHVFITVNDPQEMITEEENQNLKIEKIKMEKFEVKKV